MVTDRQWEEITRGRCKGEVRFGEPMRDHTSLGIGGPADVFVSPADPMSMKSVVQALRRHGVPLFPIGRGTNILVRDNGIEGVVMTFSGFSRIEVIDETEAGVTLFVEAGALLQRLLNLCKERGYSGMEGLAGIPGTLGGAICGNAGSYGCEIKDVVESVVLMMPDGSLDRRDRDSLGFSYRSSDIPQDVLVLSVNLGLRKDDPKEVAARVERFLGEKKRTQPISLRSAGCVFRNPQGLSAGKVIDEAGCKGMRVGGVEVSEIHGNFFLNRGGGTAVDYLGLMEEVSRVVDRRFGIRLEPEIRVVGRQ